MLRHTFLQKLAETRGVQYAKEVSGHKTDRYIWRYVKPDQQTLAEAIDGLERFSFAFTRGITLTRNRLRRLLPSPWKGEG